MRPTVGVKPLERAVAYTNLPANIPDPQNGWTMGFSVGVATTTDYAKITWWDNTEEIVDCASFLQKLGGTVNKGMGYKVPLTGGIKKIIVEPCDFSGKLTGNITMFTCDRRKSYPTNSGSEQYNQRTITLDVSTCQQLKVLKCDRNTLTSLGDINACKNIATIACSGNCFASLDVSKLPNLEQFFCNHNFNLKNLTIGSNIKRFGISSCGLTGISFPSGSQLYELYIKDSALNSVTLDNMTNLIKASFVSQENNPYETNIKSLTTISGNSLSNLREFNIGVYNYCSNFIGNKVSSIRMQSSFTGGNPTPTVGNYILSDWNSSLILNGCSLSTSALNTIYSDLKDITGGSPINIEIAGITGFAASNKTTATSKNYLFGSTC